MKKFFLILICIFTVIGIFSAANAGIPVHRGVKCVPLVNGSKTICTSNLGLYEYQVNWAAECTTNRVTSEIKGVGLCSNQDANNLNLNWTDPSTIQETITTSNDVNQNKYCWCKMTTPAVSLWVFTGAPADAGSCARDCADSCANIVQLNEVQYTGTTIGDAFRSALFSNMTD